ncbi:MAG: XRE family transcriptional regulator [Sphingobacteriia bacterium]|nr:MAG: XRE family transcriptional regulator [Sphingobacteriia bacterium]
MHGNKIRMVRLGRGMTQEIVAQKIGTTQNAYSKIETGNVKISDEVFDKLANIFGVSVEDLKSPEPVIINFHNSPQSSSYNKGEINYTSEHILEQLTLQLKEKDNQMNQLLQQMKELIIQQKILIESK